MACPTCATSASPSIVQGNKSTIVIKLLADGVPVDNLALAIAMRFVAIDTEGNIVIDKELADMSVDDPSTGHVKIPLTSVDTDLDPGKYDIAFQVTWGATDVLEWTIPEPLRILKGVIP